MEQRLREMEAAMQDAEGGKLEEIMNSYSRLSSEFDRRNATPSAVKLQESLKALDSRKVNLIKNFLPVGRSADPGCPRKASSYLPGYSSSGRANQPPGSFFHRLAGRLSAELHRGRGNRSSRPVFSDRIVTKIIEIDQGNVTSFDGDYTAYSQKKAMMREIQWKAYLNQQEEIRHQEAVIAKLRSFNREKSIRRAESREKMLEKMEVLEKPSEEKADMHLKLTPRVLSGNDVLTVRSLSKSYSGTCLFSDLDFSIKRGEKVAVIGDNGTGKTTILKILNGLVTPDQGSFTLGSKVQIGYYDQEHQVLHMDKTLLAEISDTYPEMTGTQIRNLLAAFLFTGDDVYKRIRDLSGGERGRLSLARLMLSEANFLILDEPTNHLDIVSKEILEEAIRNYTGTVLYVSHDRYFINQTATRILELKHQTLINYIGNYDYYLEKNQELSRLAAKEEPSAEASSSQPSQSREEWNRMKEAQAKERKRRNEIQKTEDAIASLEDRDKEIDGLLELEEVFTDLEQCTALMEEKAKIGEKLTALYEYWEQLSEET